ncbi:MAG: hypothetical protein L0H64_15810 [Pseudonocardia sp.]|nr:hypothetical protein [Pseudonocardia sp.]
MTTVAPAPTATTTTPARRTPWPYAALASGLAFGASTMFLAQGEGTFAGGAPSPATASFIVENLNSGAVVQLGGTLALVGLAASLVFLLGLTRFHARHAPRREGLVEALRWCSIAFLGTGGIGVVLHYVAAGGVPGGIDEAFYTPEASATIAVLADQLSFAAFLPGLAVMAVVGVLAVRDRVLPLGVGIVALVLAAASTAATVALGLPYSAGLVWPLFALVVGVAGIASRRTDEFPTRTASARS